MRSSRTVFVFVLAAGAALTLPLLKSQESAAQPGSGEGSVIFFHPDGMGVNTWGAVRMMTVGPDGRLNWDKLPYMAVYTGHMKDRLTSTSHGGATTHAYGVKVLADSYGMDGKEPLTSASGFEGSILQEAKAAGLAVGMVNSGTITEPGSGVFAATYSVDGSIDQPNMTVNPLAALTPGFLRVLFSAITGERDFPDEGAEPDFVYE